MEKHHLFYKVTNLVNGKYYYGVHSTINPGKDGYLGSGTRIKAAIQKYGRENFIFEIIRDCSTREEALLLEQECVNEECCLDSNCYNLKEGGLGGAGGMVGMTKGGINTLVKPDLVVKYEKLGWVKGYHISPEGLRVMSRPRSEETKNRMREAQKLSKERQRKEGTGMFSEESIKRRSEAHRGLKQSLETRKKRSESSKGRISIFRGDEQKFIHREKLLEYQERGWVAGVPDSKREKARQQVLGKPAWNRGVPMTVEKKQNLTEKRRVQRKFTKDSIRKWFNPDQFQTAIADGWVPVRPL